MNPEMWNNKYEQVQNSAEQELHAMEEEFDGFSDENKKEFSNYLEENNDAFEEFKNWKISSVDKWNKGEEVLEDKMETSKTEVNDSVEAHVQSPKELAFKHIIAEWQKLWGQFISPDIFKSMPANVQDIVLTFMTTWEINNDIRAVINNVKKINLAEEKRENEFKAQVLDIETVNNWINQEELKNSLWEAVATTVKSVWKTNVNWTDVYFTVVKDIRKNSKSMDNLLMAIAADNEEKEVNITPESYVNEKWKEVTGMNFSSMIVDGKRIIYTAIWKITNSGESVQSKDKITSNKISEVVNIDIDWDKPSLKDIVSNLDKAWDTDNPSVKKLILWWKEVFIAEVRKSKAQSLAMQSAIMQLRKTSSYPVWWTENFTYNWKQYVIPNLKQLT